MEELLAAVETSEVHRAGEIFKEKIRQGMDAWKIPGALFPVAQRVLNQPFITSHLPKMYRIFRELAFYLNRDEIPALVQLELWEWVYLQGFQQCAIAEMQAFGENRMET